MKEKKTNFFFFFSKPMASSKAMKLGGKSKDVDSFVDQVTSLMNLSSLCNEFRPKSIWTILWSWGQIFFAILDQFTEKLASLANQCYDFTYLNKWLQFKSKSLIFTIHKIDSFEFWQTFVKTLQITLIFKLWYDLNGT
jgi:hypothetical protein